MEFKIKKKMHFKKYNNLSDDMTFFQNTKFLNSFLLNRIIYSLMERKLLNVYEMLCDKELVLAMYLFKKKQALSLSKIGGISNNNFIYFKNSEDNLSEYITFLLKKFKVREFKMERIPENSRLGEICKKGFSGYSAEIQKIENVSINFSNGYEEWYNGLSKSVRQNLRTAHNRLAKDGLDLKLAALSGGCKEKGFKKSIRELINLYVDRHLIRYNLKTSFLKKTYLKYFDFVTRELIYNEKARHYILYINGEIAAFFSGFYDETNSSISVPRLSINDDYGRYSPGYLLIEQTIKSLCDDGIIFNLDLTEGTEKYKTDLGGEIYNNLSIQLYANKTEV